MTSNTQGMPVGVVTATRDVLAGMGSEEEITLMAIAILESALRSADPDALIT